MRPEHRLRSRADFARVVGSGSRQTAGTLTLHHLPRAEGPARIGFAVGRRLGGAVVRNRTKRRLREAARHLIAGLRTADIVVVCRPGAERATVAELERDLRDAAARAGLLSADRPDTMGHPESKDESTS